MTRGDGGRSERRGPSVFTAVVVSVLGVTTPAQAGANPSQARAVTQTSQAEHARRKLVTVKLAGDTSSVAAVLDVLRERVGGTSNETSFEVVPAIDRASVVTPGPRNDEQLARIWIDLTEPHERDPVTLYVVDGLWERVLVRPVARQTNPEVVWEEIGHIVELALGALRAGEIIGVGRAIAREQLLPSPQPELAASTAPVADHVALPPPKPANAKPPLSLRVGGYLSSTAYGGSLENTTGPGCILEVHTRTRLFNRTFEYGALVTGEYRFPSTVDRGSAIVRFEGAAFHAMASAGLDLTPRHHLALAVGGGAELVHARGSSPELENVRFVDGNLDAIPAARVLTRYGYSMSSSLRLFAGVGVDLPFRNPRYLLSRVNEPVVLFEPWTVRPFVLLGLETN